MPRTRVTRRTLLKTLAATGATSILGGCLDFAGSSEPALPVPPEFIQPPLRSAGADGVLDTTLVTKFATNTVDGKIVNTRTYEGMIGGPTLRCRPGQTLRIKIDNQLPANTDAIPANVNIPHHFNTTNLHTHGLHVSPSGNSDNVFVEIPPGEKFQYEYHIPADHPAGTFWYHPHQHGSSSMQSLGGMGGALIIAGGLDELPEIAAARDLVFLINELNIDPATGKTPDFTGDVFLQANRILTVNGQVRPKLSIFSGEVVRLRVINASARSTIPLSIEGHDIHLLALDGITLRTRRTTSQPVVLAPANRADILIVGKAPGSYNILQAVDNSGAQPIPASVLGLLEVLPTTVTMALPTNLPAPASLPDILAAEINAPRRSLDFQVLPRSGPLPGTSSFKINGAAFDPAVINHTVALGNVEEWTLSNASDTVHPFHIHINPFQVIAINGIPLPVPEWRDTVNIPNVGAPDFPGTVTIRHRFTDFKGLFVLHCHILVHEDLGMMHTVKVV